MRVSHKVAVKTSAGAEIIWRPEWVEDLFPRWLTHITVGRRPEFLIPVGQRPQFLSMWVSTRAVHDVEVGFPHSERSKRTKASKTEPWFSYNFISEVRYHYFCHILLPQRPVQRGRRPHQSVSTKRQYSWRPSWKLAIRTTNVLKNYFTSAWSQKYGNCL